LLRFFDDLPPKALPTRGVVDVARSQVDASSNDAKKEKGLHCCSP
jgi:hypothetical protein